ncbi:MAG: CBS domain-containing protein [Syntrophobacteraceae bacterium]
MLRAKDIMTREVLTVTPETEVADIAKLLLERHLNGVPVVDEKDNIVGIVCQSDLIAEQKKVSLPSFFNLLDSFIPISSTRKAEKEVQKITAMKAADAMTPDPVTISPETALDEIASIMVNRNYHTLPVTEDGKLVGIVGKEDILRTLVPSPMEKE